MKNKIISDLLNKRYFIFNLDIKLLKGLIQ
jgi:hypothetical protein